MQRSCRIVAAIVAVCCFNVVGLLVATASADGRIVDSLLLRSVGGESARRTLAKSKGGELSGTAIVNGQAGSILICHAPPRRSEITFSLDSIAWQMGFDGTTAWSVDFNQNVRLLEGAERRELVAQTFLLTHGYFFWPSDQFSIRYDGLVSWNGRRVHQLLFDISGADSVRMLIDSASGLHAGEISWQDQYQVETRHSEHRRVAGVMMIGRSDVTTSGTRLSSTFQFDSIAIGSPCLPDSRAVGQIPPEQRPAFRFHTSAAEVRLPITVSFGHVWFVGAINGKQRAFLLDSGASTNILDSAGTADLACRQYGSLQAQGIAAFSTVNLVHVDSLTFGELTIVDQVAGRLDLSPLARGNPFPDLPMGGIVGADLLHLLPVEIRYPRAELILHHPDSFLPRPRAVGIPMHFNGAVPSVEATVAGLPGRFLLDIGNAFGLILHEAFVRRHGLDSLLSETGLSRLLGGIGGGMEARELVLRQFSLGSIQFDSLLVLAAEPSGGIGSSVEISGNIGYEILSKFDLIVHYRQRLLYLQAPGRE